MPLPLCTASRMRGRIARSGLALHAAWLALQPSMPRSAAASLIAHCEPLSLCAASVERNAIRAGPRSREASKLLG